MPVRVVSSISPGFPELSQSEGQVTHVLLTRSPLITQEQAPKITVRLACVKHAASVRPEPGSNSPLMFKPQHPNKQGERKNKPRRVTDSSRAERVKLTQFQFNQRKTRSTPATQRPPKQTEIKLGIDFWHAVEFSRIGRTPTQHPPASHRGNHPNLL